MREKGRALLVRILPLLSFFAGVLNGLFGTGGGMLLTLSLRAAYPGEERSSMAISTACVLSFSILTIILYTLKGYMRGAEPLPILLPAFLGGAAGALLLGRLHTRSLDLVLGALLLYSGVTLLL